jgi:hypothetical protein
MGWCEPTQIGLFKMPKKLNLGNVNLALKTLIYLLEVHSLKCLEDFLGWGSGEEGKGGVYIGSRHLLTI